MKETDLFRSHSHWLVRLGVHIAMLLLLVNSVQQLVVKSLMKNLRLKNPQDAEIGYQSLQWLYSLDIKPTVPGIQNMARLLALGNPKVKSVKMEDIVDETPWQRLEKSSFYRELGGRK